MPNLKDIRTRIRSVKNTQKITQAMRMVAAAKVKRAEVRMKRAKPFADQLRQLFESTLRQLQPQLADLESSPYLSLLQGRNVRSVGLLVISSDRGLCGAYNASLFRQLSQKLDDYKKQGITPKLYMVGNKGVSALRLRFADTAVLGKLSGLGTVPEPQDAQEISNSLIQAYLQGEIDAIDCLSTEFKSMISSKSRHDRLMPVQLDSSETASPQVKGPLQQELLLEPDPVSIINTLVPMYLSRIVFSKLLDASASELAARMTAMASATDNAKKMINRLTLQYNKARQASITQEIMEIVGGAEALNG